MQVALEVGDAPQYLRCQFFRAMALLHLGQWGEMRYVLQESIATAEKNGHLPWLICLRLALAWLHEQAGDYVRARELSEQGLKQSQALQFKQGRLLSVLLLGSAQLGLKQYERAIQCFRDITYLFERERGLQVGPVQIVLSHCLSAYWWAQGDFTRARQEAERLCELAAHPGERTYLALGKRLLAEIAFAERKWGQAEAVVSQALAVLEGAEAPLAEWRVCATAAQLHQRRGDKAEAQTYWTRSAAVLKRLADSLSEVPALRHSLLNAPRVRGVLRRARIESHRRPQL